MTLKWAMRCVVLLGVTSGSATGLAEDEAPATLPPLRIIQGFNEAGDAAKLNLGVGLVITTDETGERVLVSDSQNPNSEFGAQKAPTVFKENNQVFELESGLELMRGGFNTPGTHWSVWRSEQNADSEQCCAAFSTSLPKEGLDLFGPVLNESGELVWQKCIVTGFFETDHTTVILTTMKEDSSRPTMLFDTDGRLTAVLVAVYGINVYPRPRVVTHANRQILKAGGVVAYVPVVDLVRLFDLAKIPVSDALQNAFHRREVIHLDRQRPVAAESLFLSWSDNHDELQGFSRKTGKTTKWKVKPQDLFLWATSADAVVVKLGDTVAGYSSITESWDELTLPVPPAHVVSAGGKLYLQGPLHHYEFSATVGKWISPTDTEIDAKRALHTDAQPLESTPQIALAHPSQANAERQVADSTYNAAQQSSLQAARDYRAEAGQETPDPNAIAELKEKLAASVKAAFEAQMNLQQVRIQIAQQDLAEVVAKHQRRQSLADKIIERRIEDLINGDDLEWAARKKDPSAAIPKKSLASRGPIPEAVKDRAKVQELVQDWSKRTRALGDNSAEQRDAAIKEIETALQSDDVIQLRAATTALAQLEDVKFDKTKYRERLLELARSDDGDIQTTAFHALFNTDRNVGNLALLQEVLSGSHSKKLEYSAMELLRTFGNGVMNGTSEDIVLNLLNSSDSTVRMQALKGLFGIKTSDKLTARMIELVDDKESHDDAIDRLSALS